MKHLGLTTISRYHYQIKCRYGTIDLKVEPKVTRDGSWWVRAKLPHLKEQDAGCGQTKTTALADALGVLRMHGVLK